LCQKGSDLKCGAIIYFLLRVLLPCRQVLCRINFFHNVVGHFKMRHCRNRPGIRYGQYKSGTSSTGTTNMFSVPYVHDHTRAALYIRQTGEVLFLRVIFTELRQKQVSSCSFYVQSIPSRGAWPGLPDGSWYSYSYKYCMRGTSTLQNGTIVQLLVRIVPCTRNCTQYSLMWLCLTYSKKVL
jgi:hypothetical protein